MRAAAVGADISTSAVTKYGMRYLVYTGLNYSKGLIAFFLLQVIYTI